MQNEKLDSLMEDVKSRSTLIYFEGVLDGIGMIKDMITKNKETADLDMIEDACDTFIEDIRNGNLDDKTEPEEAPQEFKEAGMSKSSYDDLLDVMDNMEDNSYDENFDPLAGLPEDDEIIQPLEGDMIDTPSLDNIGSMGSGVGGLFGAMMGAMGGLDNTIDTSMLGTTPEDLAEKLNGAIEDITSEKPTEEEA